ncbi:MAG: NUDIX hydrolase [Actinomycetia bacterium]|nr:NUDIX hydrolase [Actinomycetes bacterium]
MTDTSGFRVIARKTVTKVGFLNITLATIETPDHSQVERIVIEHPGAVAVVPRIGDDVILVAQYRAAVDAVVLEIPAGKLDVPGEDPSEAAVRELSEETGYVAQGLRHLTDLFTTVGFCNEKITIFLASDPTPGNAAPIGAEEESAEIIVMPWVDALDAVANGTITDAKTIAGILIAEMVS